MRSEVGYILILIGIVLFMYSIMPYLRMKDKKKKVRGLIFSGAVYILIFGILTSISFYRDHKKRSAPPMVNNTATGHQKSSIVVESGDALAPPMNTTEQGKTESPSPLDMEMNALLERWNRHHTLSESDKQKIAAMMDQFEDLESMSEADIINKLIGFLPKAYQKIPQYRKLVEDYYKGLDGNPVTSYQKDEKVLITVSFVYRTLVSYNDMRTSVAEQVRKDLALKAADPELYYETKIQEERDQIAVKEQQIRDAEAEGDSEWADLNRDSLAISHRYIEWLEFDRNFDENINKMVAEGLKERLPQVQVEFQDRLRQIIAEYEAASKPVSSQNTEVPDVLSTPSDTVTATPTTSGPDVSDTSAYDPVRSFTSAQSRLESWRSDFNESYIDVVASRYMSPEELDEFFPTPQEREHLKSRTTELQKLVVSQVRKLVSDVKGATAEQKRSLARELVNKNFDKDFAKSILSELEKETE